uniref:Protein kinase domain-containing protein n=1 Tax=Rhizophagus irregularis (strain DAOM 181602 / DAOM 197198 / MUCL 43194) TaxID=747089 RepID=U9T2N4_RHIID
MEEVNLSDEVIEQIKDFNNRELTKEQNALINKLIPNEGLKENYEMYGLCKERKHINTSDFWCQICESKSFQKNFKNWTSGNSTVDEFIQKAQLKAKKFEEILEWIEYNKLENFEYLAKGGFGVTYKAIWKDGYIKRDYKNDKWIRNGETKVALKCLYDSQNITTEFLKEILKLIISLF